MHLGRCRYKDYAGVLVTYYQNGGQREVFHFLHGFLDGPVEFYDQEGLLTRRLAFINGIEQEGDLPPNLHTVDTDLGDQRLYELYWPDRRLAEVRCRIGEVILKFRTGRCHYKTHTGILITHHQNGSVAQMFRLNGGVLDGEAETYDAEGNLVERVVFRNGAEESLAGLDLKQLVGKRLGPVQTLDRPPVLPAEIRGSGPPGHFLPRPPFPLTLEIGFDTQFVAARSSYGSFYETGTMLVHTLIQFHRHLGIEVDLPIMPNWGLSNRTDDWPVLRVGLRVPLTSGRFAPYLLGGASVLTGETDIQTADPTNPIQDTAWYLGLDAGLGFTLRVTEAMILSLDVRFGRNFRVDSDPHLLMANESGEVHELMGSYYSCTTNFGIGVRF